MDAAPGDKIMQIENDYDKEVYNSDIGYIDDVDPDEGELTASFDGRAYYESSSSSTLVPAYAVTNKSKRIGIRGRHPGMTQHYTMLQRNLLYTGVTRRKRRSAGSAGRRRPTAPSPCENIQTSAVGQNCANGCNR